MTATAAVLLRTATRARGSAGDGWMHRGTPGFFCCGRSHFGCQRKTRSHSRTKSTRPRCDAVWPHLHRDCTGVSGNGNGNRRGLSRARSSMACTGRLGRAWRPTAIHGGCTRIPSTARRSMSCRRARCFVPSQVCRWSTLGMRGSSGPVPEAAAAAGRPTRPTHSRPPRCGSLRHGRRRASVRAKTQRSPHRSATPKTCVCVCVRAHAYVERVPRAGGERESAAAVCDERGRRDRRHRADPHCLHTLARTSATSATLAHARTHARMHAHRCRCSLFTTG